MAFRDIHEEILERGHQHSARVVLTVSLRANASLAQTLKLRTGSGVFNSVLLHCEDGVPIQFEDRLVNPAAAPDYLVVDFEQTTPTHYLLEHAPQLVRLRASKATIGLSEDSFCQICRPQAATSNPSIWKLSLIYAGRSQKGTQAIPPQLNRRQHDERQFSSQQQGRQCPCRTRHPADAIEMA